MQDDKPANGGAPSQHPRQRKQKDEEVLSSVEFQRSTWGREFKRQIKTAASRVELYEDAVLAERVGVSRNAVQGWWQGARPSAQTLTRLSRVIGLSPEALYSWVYDDGPAPDATPIPDGAAAPDDDAAERQARAWQDTLEGRSPARPSAPRTRSGR